MAKVTVQTELTHAQEIALMDRYGRRCSRETLVKRAITEILKQQAENVPVFLGKSEYEAREAERKAQEEAERQARTDQVPSEVKDLLVRFGNGERLIDLEGREVSNLVLPDEDDSPEPLLAQFNGDDSEWFPVSPKEIRPAETQQ